MVGNDNSALVLPRTGEMAMPRSWKIPRKILCATDLTPSSDKAVDRAIQLAGEWKASLLLVHIVDDTGLLTKDFTPDVHRAEAQLQRQIAMHPAAIARSTQLRARLLSIRQGNRRSYL